MLKIINIIEIIFAVALVISILLQNRGAGLSSTFGSGFEGYHTRRGFEKFLVFSSVFLSVMFVVFAVINLILSNNKLS